MQGRSLCLRGERRVQLEQSAHTLLGYLHHPQLQGCSPRWRLSWLISLPRGSAVTRRLPSQWPPLNSSFPSGSTARACPLTPLPGTHGPLSSRCILTQWGMTSEARPHRRPRPSDLGQTQRLASILTGWGDAHPCPQPSVLLGGIFDEPEVVAYVTVIGQPAVGAQQPIGTHSHLWAKEG